MSALWGLELDLLDCFPWWFCWQWSLGLSYITPCIMKYNEKYNKVICLGWNCCWTLFVIVLSHSLLKIPLSCQTSPDWNDSIIQSKHINKTAQKYTKEKDVFEDLDDNDFLWLKSLNEPCCSPILKSWLYDTL